MEVERHSEPFEFGPQRPELRLVEVVAVNVVVVQDPFESELLHRPVQLGHGGLRVLQRQGGEAGEPSGVSGDHFGQVVVDPACRGHGLGGIRDGLHTG